MLQRYDLNWEQPNLFAGKSNSLPTEATSRRVNAQPPPTPPRGRVPSRLSGFSHRSHRTHRFFLKLESISYLSALTSQFSAVMLPTDWHRFKRFFELSMTDSDLISVRSVWTTTQIDTNDHKLFKNYYCQQIFTDLHSQACRQLSILNYQFSIQWKPPHS